ncbi:TPA: DUF2059 domain-containing protein [Neisseria subflava]|jgi:putative periplasmic protein|uniref:DUF2059 domain-containing protein n=1 Tax=Neisseria subflava TaxID=28449 RepID=A0A9X9HT79_NEISU|nr:DUF2059 domain-containing protein [Neisseria subflava]UTG69043.1 DUF2059 domain-containing protein [Neisseria subflava]
MKLKTLLLPFAALALCANAFAATPSDESLERLYQVQKADLIFDQVFQDSEKMVMSFPQVKEMLANAPESKQRQLKAVMSKYLRQMYAEIRTPAVYAELRQITLNGMKTVYTQKEVDAMIDFYSSPEGQSILNKTSRYMEASVVPVMTLIHKKTERFSQKNLPKLEKDFYQIMCSGKNPAPACPKASNK